MEKSRIIGSVLAIAGVALAAYLFRDPQAPTPEDQTAGNSADQAAHAQLEQARKASVGLGPFSSPPAALASGSAASVDPSTGMWARLGNAEILDAAPEGDAEAHAGLQEEIKRQNLRELGYFIDSAYYQMGLTGLQNAAKQGDVQAMTHLAERYLFEYDGNPGAPEYQYNVNYREEARRLLQEAFSRGNLHAAAMVSESFLTERNVQDATAWSLVARRAGDELSATWFTTTSDFQALSAEQRQLAAQQSEKIWQDLQARRQNLGRSG